VTPSIPNTSPPWVDEDGNFDGWLSEAEVTALLAQDETLPDQELADWFAANDAGDDEF
jgi:hypothetical protein